MKIQKIITLLLVFCLLTAFTACSKITEKPLTGRYVIVDISDDPDGMTFANLKAIYNEINQNLEEYMFMELMENGQFELVLFGQTEMFGMYSHNEKTLTLITGNETMTAEISDKKITWTYENGTKLIFEMK